MNPPTVPNTMTFHCPEGKEVYRLGSAVIRTIRDEDGLQLLFEVGTEGKPIEPLPDRTLDTQPNAEVSVSVSESDLSALVGKRFEVPHSFDEELDDHVSCICYYGHLEFNQIVVSILGCWGNRLHVRWTGTMDESRRDDGSPPSNRVVIDGLFQFVD